VNIKLDRRIQIQEAVTSQDTTYGTESIAWLTVATVWAEVQDVLPSRAEGISADLVTRTKPTRIRLRWFRGLTSKSRIKITYPEARTLQIISGPADISGRRAYMEIMCEEVSTVA
jgi:SPP1 family predicted phage head-tail adaptor